jgi:hypothetical protein
VGDLSAKSSMRLHNLRKAWNGNIVARLWWRSSVNISARAAARDRCDGSMAPVNGVPCPFRQPFLLDLNATVAVRVRSVTAR